MIKLATQFKPLIAWNTGRLYTEVGQPIAVFEVIVDGELAAYYMNDAARGLYYYFRPLTYANPTREEVRDYVMSAYDHRAQIYQVFQDEIAAGVDDFDEARCQAHLMTIEYPMWVPYQGY